MTGIDKDQLSRQVEAFTAWKQAIAREISRYRGWLNNQGLNNREVDNRLANALKTLRFDRILLAFVGEFSRGKSELINAILGKHYGQRLLPTRIGRTTMCPTELFYDSSATGAYIKLLPIQTRGDNVPLSTYKGQLEHWVHLTINLDDPAALKKTFTEVSQTREVSLEAAAELGFQVEYLEPSLAKPGHVHIPAWRHALINIDHPLLRQGLAIIDTPGLNALGSEPELTLSLLPDAQALVFVLSADSGVTASDFAIWNNHVKEIAQRRGAAVYAVLNKIDLLWDDDDEPEEAEESVNRLARLTAKQLHLSPDNVLPLSAKQGLKARMHNNAELLARSRLETLEGALARSVVQAKEAALKTTLVRELTDMVEASRQAVLAQRVRLEAEERVQASGQRDVEHELVLLTRAAQQEKAAYNKRLLFLQQSRKLLEQQLPRLVATLAPDKLEAHFARAREQASSNRLGMGVPSAVTGFFQGMRMDFGLFRQEMETTQLLVQKLYQRYTQETGAAAPPVPRMDAGQFLREMDDLEAQAGPYKNRLSSLLTSQQKVFERFFETLAREAARVHEQARKEGERWSKQSLAPLIQQALESRKRLEAQMATLEKLRAMGSNSGEGSESPLEQRETLREQQTLLEDILGRIKDPALA
ncbi:MAG: dynamin family protein [Moraxellaceae bacterium]|jgi:predicted GTPase|nr:dynamin family protein [Moraxellaceae bacterium]MBP8852883.1 dynamin family protein [Moraxellaceae bacterium]MBP9044782.1 dynamin family protein [Moraxellaceae bacterium]MBP9730279.1 dynamin family protein [Moraxellaceae bacterium]HQV41489.1 dynamin family protein [Moraxellaceae bacterium]